MDRQRTLQRFAQQISTASQAEDWDGLSRSYTLMQAALPELAALGPLQPQERSALAALREQHAEAERRRGHAAASVAGQLQDLHDNQEGRTAYALESLLAETEN
jgi:hypothetical protein